MKDVAEQLENLAKVEKRVAMVTLVATRGTAPKKEGAKMWVGEGGHLLGAVTIGGCVDARAIEASEQALASFQPQVLSMSLGEEDAWEGGFTCAGTIDILIEPVDLAKPEDRLCSLYRSIRDEVSAGRCVVVATPLDSPAFKFIVHEDGRSSGELGAPELDRQAKEIAPELIRKRTSRTIALASGRNSSDVFFELHGPPPTLIVFGAGHVSTALVHQAKSLGLKTIVVDGRPRFATKERFPEADELLVGIPSEIARGLRYTSSTYVVLAAHDYKYDIPVLKIVLNTEAAYIGMLSSKRRGDAILGFLEKSGVERQALDRVRVPIGLDIGATTASEIALSILAEAVAVRTNRPGTPLKAR
ncbi:MAG TPA: XdhC family protein [Blastocatellia bacterium]|nr:XdhC family protein [Blastocatellia bacterium]